MCSTDSWFKFQCHCLTAMNDSLLNIQLHLPKCNKTNQVYIYHCRHIFHLVCEHCFCSNFLKINVDMNLTVLGWESEQGLKGNRKWYLQLLG